jgi:hypothetical protein
LTVSIKGHTGVESDLVLRSEATPPPWICTSGKQVEARESKYAEEQQRRNRNEKLPKESRVVERQADGGAATQASKRIFRRGRENQTPVSQNLDPQVEFITM